MCWLAARAGLGLSACSSDHALALKFPASRSWIGRHARARHGSSVRRPSRMAAPDCRASLHLAWSCHDPQPVVDSVFTFVPTHRRLVACVDASIAGSRCNPSEV